MGDAVERVRTRRRIKRVASWSTAGSVWFLCLLYALASGESAYVAVTLVAGVLLLGWARR